MADAEKTDQADQSHVPPVLRNLRKCEACGFPVSAGRVLCVECEEKKWRGQLKPKPSPRHAAAISVAAEKSGLAKLPTGTEPKKEGASSGAEMLTADVLTTDVLTKEKLSPRESDAQPQLKADIRVATEAVAVGSAVPSTQPGSAESGIASAANATAATPDAKDPSLDFVFSAGLAPSQSWLAANKYVVGVLLLVAVAVVVVFLLR